MARASKPHPGDVRDRERIARAVAFLVHLRTSPFQTYSEGAETLEDARAAALRLEGEHSRHGRRAGVYAVGVDGSSTFVPADYQPEAQPKEALT